MIYILVHDPIYILVHDLHNCTLFNDLYPFITYLGQQNINYAEYTILKLIIKKSYVHGNTHNYVNVMFIPLFKLLITSK